VAVFGPNDFAKALADHLEQSGFLVGIEPIDGHLAAGVVVPATHTFRFEQPMNRLFAMGIKAPMIVLGAEEVFFLEECRKFFFETPNLVFLDRDASHQEIAAALRKALAPASGRKPPRKRPRKPKEPAAGRVIPIDHNSPDVIDVKAKLERLSHAVRGDNELSANPEEKLAYLFEIEDIKEKMNRPAVRLRAMWEATKPSGVIGWLADKAFGGLVGDAAKAAAIAIWKFILPFL
jgi:hypothetical protein